MGPLTRRGSVGAPGSVNDRRHPDALVGSGAHRSGLANRGGEVRLSHVPGGWRGTGSPRVSLRGSLLSQAALRPVLILVHQSLFRAGERIQGAVQRTPEAAVP